jgi:hypothetical protein
VAFGAILLDDFLRYLENPAGFTTVTTSAAAAINLKPLTKGWVPFARSGRAPFTLSKANAADKSQKAKENRDFQPNF